MSTCEGQCYLNKQLDEATEKQASDWMDFRADFNLFILEEVAYRICRIPATVVIKHVANVQKFFLQDYFLTQDKPPKEGTFIYKNQG